jgi:hypothetical protein
MSASVRSGSGRTPGWLAAMGVLLGATGGAACAGKPSWQGTPHDRVFQRAPSPRLHPRFKAVPHSEVVYVAQNSGVRPFASLFNPGSYVRRADSKPEAVDVNHFGQVPDSTWFTNRIGRRHLSPAEVMQGPNDIEGPAPGPLLVLGGKVEGVSPGFVIRDGRERRFVVKLDHPAYPELSSAAELVATKALWAAGYNVPQNFIQTVALDRFVLSPDATTGGRYGGSVPLTQEGFASIISNANPNPDGTIRALFSRIIEGDAIGPFAYEGRRSEDPNDLLPHERRRSLRGLGTFYAWLNNTDARESNTLDVFIRPDASSELGYVKHYLLDFGDSLGAAGTEPKYIQEGYEHLVDLEFMAYGLLSLGIYYRYWLPVQRSPFRSVGTFEAEVFDPRYWRSAVPNPAFAAATARDRYWAAAILSRFTPRLVEAIVETGQYSDPNAKAWVLRILLLRQIKLMEDAFSRVLPLDDVRQDGSVLQLTDLAVRTGLVSDNDGYRVTIGSEVDAVEVQRPTPRIDLAPWLASLPRFTTVRFRRNSESRRWVDVHLRIDHPRVVPVGLHRNVD